MEDIRSAIKEHFRPGLAKAVAERVREAMPHYLWFWPTGRKGKQALCTGCCQWDLKDGQGNSPRLYRKVKDAMRSEKAENDLEISFWDRDNRGESVLNSRWQHKQFSVCPNCGRVVECRSVNTSHLYMRDHLFLAHYSRSAADPEMVVMTLWHGDWDFSGFRLEDGLPDPDIQLTEMCLMKRGWAGARYAVNSFWTADWRGGTAFDYQRHVVWKKRKEVISGYVPPVDKAYFAPSRPAWWALDVESVSAAFQGGPVLEIADAIAPHSETAHYLDRISLFQTILRHPQLEYLVKIGQPFLAAAVVDRKTERTLNLRGKTAQAVLRVDGDMYGYIKGLKEPLDVFKLRQLQRKARLGLRISNDAALALMRHPVNCGDYFLDHVTAALPRPLWEKALKYVLKHGIPSHDYLDHLNIMERLDMDLGDAAMALPKDFAETHGKLAQRLAAITSREKDEIILKRAGKLGEYWFSALGLTLRPMLSAEEIIREGAQLSHCVGSYVNRYAQGDTVLLCLREDTALDTPLYTVEYSKAGARVQVRGYKNGHLQPGYANGVKIRDLERLDLFWRLFEAYRADYRKQHKKGGRVAA